MAAKWPTETHLNYFFTAYAFRWDDKEQLVNIVLFFGKIFNFSLLKAAESGSPIDVRLL